MKISEFGNYQRNLGDGAKEFLSELDKSTDLSGLAVAMPDVMGMDPQVTPEASKK